MTEPGAGSDVVTWPPWPGVTEFLRGERRKNLQQAGWSRFCDARGADGRFGAEGISLLCVNRAPGFERTELRKTGWWMSDTATLLFDDCRVPAANLLGRRTTGLSGSCATSTASASCFPPRRSAFPTCSSRRRVLGQAAPGVRQAPCRAPGHPAQNRGHGHVRDAARALLDATVEKYRLHGDAIVDEICMLKNLSANCMQLCADGAVQVLGGSGYIRGPRLNSPRGQGYADRRRLD